MHILEVNNTYGERLKVFNYYKLLFNSKHTGFTSNSIGISYQPEKKNRTNIYSGL
jgi:hypothetical protein